MGCGNMIFLFYFTILSAFSNFPQYTEIAFLILKNKSKTHKQNFKRHIGSGSIITLIPLHINSCTRVNSIKMYHFLLVSGSGLMPPKQNFSTIFQVSIPEKQTLRHRLHAIDLLGSSLRIKTRGSSRKERKGGKKQNWTEEVDHDLFSR